MSYQSNTPGTELTPEEQLILQDLADLGTPGQFITVNPTATGLIYVSDLVAPNFYSESGSYNFKDSPTTYGIINLTSGEYSFLNGAGNAPRVKMGILELYNEVNEAYGELRLEDTSYVFTEGGTNSDLKYNKARMFDSANSDFGEFGYYDYEYEFKDSLGVFGNTRMRILYLEDTINPGVGAFGTIAYEDEGYLIGGGTGFLQFGSANVTGFLYLGNGTASSPIYTFTSQPGSGMWRATNQLNFSVNGVSRFSIDAAGSFTASSFRMTGPVGSLSAPTWGFTNESGLGAYRIGSGIMGFVANSTERMRIDNTNIGIGAFSSFGGGAKVIGIANATTVPTTDPTGGGILYVSGGALCYRGSSGTVTVIANA